MRERPAAVGQSCAELPAGADVELGEHLAQVPFDRAGAEEELMPRQPGDAPKVSVVLTPF
jgi:hypothetical protein